VSLSTPAISGWAAGTTASTPTIPTHQADDLLVFVVHAKPTSTGTPPTFSTPSGGWVAGPTGNDGSGTAQALDAGQTWSASFYLLATSGSHGNPTCTVTNGNVNLGNIHRFRKTVAGAWILHLVYVADATSGTGYSLSGTQPTALADQVVVTSCISGNNATYNATWTRTGDGTSGTVSKLPATDGSSNNGNDLAASSAWAAMSAASASPFAMTWNNTLSGAQKGGGILIRVGEPPTATVATGTGSAHNATVSIQNSPGTPTTLPVMLVNGNGAGTGAQPRDWLFQDYTTIDEPPSSPDGAGIAAQFATNSNQTSFLLTDTPVDFSSMLTVVLTVRANVSGRVDDTLSVLTAILTADGATYLATRNDLFGIAEVASTPTLNATYANYEITMTIVSGSATKADWDAAQIRFIQGYTAVGGGDGFVDVGIDAMEIEGTYKAVPLGTGTAHDATVTTGTASTEADAGVATGTGTAHQPAVSVKPTAGVATGTGTSHQPSASVKPSAGVATGQTTPDLANTFEGGSDGVTITTGNSGGSSGNAFDAVTTSTTGPFFEADAALHGSMGMRVFSPTGGNAYTEWFPASDPTSLWTRTYFKPITWGIGRFAGILGSQASLDTGITTTISGAGALNITDIEASPVGTSPDGTIQAGAWHRLELFLDSVADVWEARLYVGANVDGLVPDWSDSGSGVSYGGSGQDLYVRTGTSVGSSDDFYIDSIGASFTDWLGPYPDGVAYSMRGTVAPTAGVSQATGTTHQPSASIRVNAGVATATGTAHNATAATTDDAPAGHATATGTAHDAAVSSSSNVSAGSAAGTGTAYVAGKTVAPNAGVATGTGTAHQATGQPAKTVSPTVATGTGTAYQPAASIAPNALVATGTGTAHNASITTTDDAPAGLATATGTAHNASVSSSSNVTAGVAQGTGTAHQPAGSVAVNAGVATAAGTAHQPAAAVVPTVPVATATGTAHDATISTSSSTNAAAEVATATGTAHAPGVSTTDTAPADVAVGAGEAYFDALGGSISLELTAENPIAATGAAYDATVTTAVSTSATAAAGTGTAFPATPGPGPVPLTATATGSAYNATTLIASNATAGVATGTGTAYGAQVTTTDEAPAGSAEGTGTAYTPGKTVAPSAGVATASGTAHDAVGLPAKAASAGVATGSGSGEQARGSVSPTALVATAAGTAYNVTAITTSNASAGVATATGTAHDAGVTTTGEVAAGSAQGTGTAHNAAVSTSSSSTAGVATGTGAAGDVDASVSPTALVATATGTAFTPGRSVSTSSGAASGSGSAYDATISTTGEVGAGLATGSGTAYGSSASVAPTAGVATAAGVAYNATASTSSEVTAAAGVAAGAGSAYNASVAVQVFAAVATAAGTAHDATVSTSTAGTDALAGLASGSGTAHDAAVAIFVAPIAAAASGTAYNISGGGPVTPDVILTGSVDDQDLTGQVDDHMLVGRAGRCREVLVGRPTGGTLVGEVAGSTLTGTVA